MRWYRRTAQALYTKLGGPSLALRIECAFHEVPSAQSTTRENTARFLTMGHAPAHHQLPCALGECA
jgi:hypothetical protein